MNVSSARKQFALVAIASFAGLGLSAGHAAADTHESDPPSTTVNEPTCPKDGKIDVTGSTKTVTLPPAPEGMVIVGYCVKAGSIQQGNGPEFVEVAPGTTEVTITHSSGKDISHYTVFYGPAPVIVDEESEVPVVIVPEIVDEESEVPGGMNVPSPEQDSQPAPVLGVDAEVFPSAPLPATPAPQAGARPAPAAQQAAPVAADGLPVTGSTSTWLASIAAAITAAGVGALRMGRRTV